VCAVSASSLTFPGFQGLTDRQEDVHFEVGNFGRTSRTLSLRIPLGLQGRMTASEVTRLVRKIPRRERKNVNLPGVVVDLPTLTSKDEEDLVQWGLPNDIDFIAASFVRKGSDLDYVRKVPHLMDSQPRLSVHVLIVP
jgi:hypothetical protein